MSLKKIKGLEPQHVWVGIIAMIGCLYLAVVSFSGIREAKAAESTMQNVSTDAELAKDVDNKKRIEQAKIDIKEAVAQMAVIEANTHAKVAEIEALEAADTGSLPLPKKMVTLLSVDGDFLGDVCFEAASESVFMSYGWRGLAAKALYHTNSDKEIDDIKIDVSDECDLELIQRILLETNPESITASAAITDTFY